MAQQTNVFLHSFLLGGILYFVDLLFETGRCIAPPGKYRVLAEDVIWMLIAALTNFLFALAYTNGVIRLYSVLAQLSVIILLHLTFGRLFRRLLLALVSAVRYILMLICRPFRLFSRKCAVFLSRKLSGVLFIKKIMFKNIKKC